MTDCRSVISLPESFCRLSNLKKLDLHSSGGWRPMKLKSLPERFGQLESLQTLNLECCFELEALPEGIPPRILPPSDALAIFGMN